LDIYTSRNAGNHIGTPRIATSLFTDGLICETAVFNRQISDAEVLAVYEKGIAGEHLI